MSYTHELKQLIQRVEETRPHRLTGRKEGLEFPKMSLAEKENRLRMFHPSYKEGSLQELKIGPSKGYCVPPEICEILEAWSRVDPDRIDLSKIAFETDVLIIGGGGAGTAAALLAQEHGARVIIATKLRHGDANTMMAEGGIQAATQPGKDSPYYHYLDTIGGGHFANVPQL
ncbi:MAG: FAD-binding protein, partial [Thermodesulfobacteriota bacterium]